MMERRRILVIAGSDSSGGAGLEADQKVLAAHKCYAMTATTALTAQNTTGVRDIHQVPSGFVRQQIDACFDDIGVDIVKTGMLASAQTVDMVANALQAHGNPTSVVDPVMVSTSGSQLLPKDATSALRRLILPLTTILTPNIPEAKLLLEDAGIPVPELDSINGIVSLARHVQKLGPAYCLLKGGHLPLNRGDAISEQEADNDHIANVLCSPSKTITYSMDYLHSKSTHGTGCSLASAIACNLAHSHTVEKAVELACQYVEIGIRTARELGEGSGPINHFHSVELKDYPECSLRSAVWSLEEEEE